MLNGKKIVLGVTGGIAVYKAVDLVSRLRKQGAEVRVIMTEHAQQFVTPLTFKEISGNKVAVSMWEANQEFNVEHIALANWADAFVVAPATANILAKELGCDCIVVHNGYYPGTYRYTGWLKRTVEFWQEFFADKDNSITIMLENQFEKDSELIKMVIDSVNDKRLKVNLDIGHANCNSDMSVYNWIKTLGKRIGYMHLHNNHGKDSGAANLDEHLDITNGTIDIKKVIKLVKQHCPKAILAIESSKNAEQSIELLKKLTK